jgi:hypothetical protein
MDQLKKKPIIIENKAEKRQQKTCMCTAIISTHPVFNMVAEVFFFSESPAIEKCAAIKCVSVQRFGSGERVTAPACV